MLTCGGTGHRDYVRNTALLTSICDAAIVVLSGCGCAGGGVATWEFQNENVKAGEIEGGFCTAMKLCRGYGIKRVIVVRLCITIPAICFSFSMPVTYLTLCHIRLSTNWILRPKRVKRTSWKHATLPNASAKDGVLDKRRITPTAHIVSFRTNFGCAFALFYLFCVVWVFVWVVMR
jgi:hypothetical protein